MGEGKSFRCRRCGHEEIIHTGIGFGFPQLYEDVVRKIRKGEYGQEWKRRFESVPGAAVNAEMLLYVCSGCGCCREDLNLSLYEPVNPAAVCETVDIFCGANPAEDVDYVMPNRLSRDYRKIKVFTHVCPECGKRMHQYKDGERIVCPECREGQMEITGEFIWD